MYNCPKCNTPFEKGTKFCPKCGCNLEESFIFEPICPTCHRKFPAGSTFCSIDGTKLVSPEKLIPRCVICGAQYSSDTKFCPKDGGAVVPDYIRYTSHNTIDDKQLLLIKASLGNRFVASLLDSIIGVALAIPSIIFFGIGLANASHGYYHTDYSGSIVFFFLAFILYFVPLIYFFIKDGFGEGQSWGKRALNLKVINITDKSNCTKASSALRTLISTLINCIPFIGWLIEPIMVLTTTDGRKIADKVAGTMVINV